MGSCPADGPSGRRATVGDGPAIDELITAADEAVQGWSEASVPELLGWWRLMDLEQGSWGLYDEPGIRAHAAAVSNADLFDLDGFVHPDHQQRGLGAWLVARGEDRARELG